MRGKTTSIGVLGAALIVLLASTAAASDSNLLPPPTEAVFRLGLTPGNLPARKAAPVSLVLAEKIANRDGSHPPALQELRVGLDRHLGLSVKGLPSCPQPLGGRQSRRNPFEECEEAKVGSGIVKLDVAFPEEAPMQVSGRLSVYNGGVREGRTMFWLFVYLPAPVTGGVLMPLEIRRGGHGRYGWIGELEIPKIANGAGSVTYLGARFRNGVFSARCPEGMLQTPVGNRFADGTLLQSTVGRAC